jgi:hypothetical protein
MSLSRDDIKRHIVKLNGGSGCLVQPIHDPQYSYILTANHVIQEDLDKIRISRLLQIDNNWDFEDIDIQNLTLNQNYFPHESKDAAIIKIPRLKSAIELITTYELDNEEGLYLCGFPIVRRIEADHNHGYRSHGKVEIKESLNHGYQEARTSENISWEEVVGISGGGIVKLEGNEMLLVGVPFQFTEADEQLNNIEFAPIDIFDEIIKGSDRRLSSIISDQTHSKKPVVRKIININLGSLSIEEKHQSELVELVVENSERIIFYPKNPGQIINECNDEIFRNWEIGYLDSTKRTLFRKSLGKVLYNILWHQKRDRIVSLLEKLGEDILLQLTFNKSEFEQDDFNYSSIPWEYLYYPGNKKALKSVAIAKKIPIIRNFKSGDSNKEETLAVLNIKLPKLTVLYVVKENFQLINNDGKSTTIEKEFGKNKTENFETTENDNSSNLNIEYIFHNMEDDAFNSVNNPEVGELIKKFKPNIVHIVADAAIPELLVDPLLNLQSESNQNKPFIIIQQSTSDHCRGQYLSYDETANYYIKEARVPSVLNIPYDLGNDLDLFTISRFYLDLTSGRNLSESFFNLTKNILNKEGLALPALYLNHSDICFKKKAKYSTEDAGDSGKDKSPNKPSKTQKSNIEGEKEPDSNKVRFENLMDKWLQDENTKETFKSLTELNKEINELSQKDNSGVKNVMAGYLDKLRSHIIIKYIALKVNSKNELVKEQYENTRILLKEIYGLQENEIDALIKEIENKINLNVLGGFNKP